MEDDADVLSEQSTGRFKTQCFLEVMVEVVIVLDVMENAWRGKRGEVVEVKKIEAEGVTYMKAGCLSSQKNGLRQRFSRQAARLLPSH